MIAQGGSPAPRVATWATSALIITILALQFSLTFRVLCIPDQFLHLLPAALQQPARMGCAPAFWPFMDYPMYNTPHYEGDLVPQIEVVATLANGSEVALQPEDLGLTYFLFREKVVPALTSNNTAELRAWADSYQQRHGQAISMLRLEEGGYTIERNGFAEAPQRVVTVWQNDR